MNASVFRKTRFEIAMIHQGPNSFGIVATERGVHGSKIERLEVPEGAFTDEEMSAVHAVFGMLEEKFAAVFDEKSAGLTKESVHQLVNDAERATARMLEADAALRAKQAEIAALDARIAAKEAAAVVEAKPAERASP